MSTAEQSKGNLLVEVGVHMSDSNTIPKQIEVLDAGLALQESSWIESNTWNHDLAPGVYMVRLNLPSGNRLEQVTQIRDGETTKLGFDISKFSPRESQEWMYLTKGNSGANPNSNRFKSATHQRSPKPPTQVSARRWQLDNFVWRAIDDIPIKNEFINEFGETFIFSVPYEMQVLEVAVSGKPSCFVCLPAAYSIKCLIKLAEGPEGVVSELDVSISTSNEKAQALLSLLTSGDMARAKTLTSVEGAESLLYSKMADPAAAAIGGYFLLRTGELARMHDWADNLANRFPWMPDGSIIHAWQMIHEAGQTVNVAAVRERFLEAVNRGIPIYTEGIRLLYDGLTILSCEFKKQDKSVEQALERIKRYTTYVDMSQETTTYTGAYPDQPGADKKDGDDITRTVPSID